MFSAWSFEDFRPHISGFGGVQDHWEPLKRVTSLETSTENKAEPSFGDFWDPFPNSIEQAESTKSASDWSDGLALPLFQARAAENPFRIRPRAPLSESLAMRRARWLLSLLDVPGPSERKRLLAQFLEIFDHYAHASTFRALTDFALDGSLGEEIAVAFQLKMVWSECPKLWTIRRGKANAPITPHNGSSVLTWARAIRLVRLSKGLPAERIIEDDWYEEWLRLPFGDPVYWSFLDYATSRREAFFAGALDLPEELHRRSENGSSSQSNGRDALDGFRLGSASRTGQLIRLATDAWGFSCFVQKEAESNSSKS
jgi:hypothetical protein